MSVPALAGFFGWALRCASYDTGFSMDLCAAVRCGAVDRLYDSDDATHSGAGLAVFLYVAVATSKVCAYPAKMVYYKPRFRGCGKVGVPHFSCC